VTSPSKIAIITGGGRGIGRAAAVQLAAAGVDSIITYRENSVAADRTVHQIEELGRSAVAFRHDASDVSSFDGFVDDVRKALKDTWNRDAFDYLVNNAGSGAPSPFSDTTEEVFDAMLNVHFKGVFFLTQKLLPVISDGGRIVNISSALTRCTSPGTAAYASMKGAIEVLTRHLAAELASRRITVNTVAPGPVATDALKAYPELIKIVAAQSVFGRIGHPDDIGGAISALLSDKSGWVTAQRLEVSGGTHL